HGDRACVRDPRLAGLGRGDAGRPLRLLRRPSRLRGATGPRPGRLRHRDVRTRSARRRRCRGERGTAQSGARRRRYGRASGHARARRRARARGHRGGARCARRHRARAGGDRGRLGGEARRMPRELQGRVGMKARVEGGHALAAGGLLDRMAKASRERARAARAAEPEGRLLARAKALPPPPALALDTFDLIAELKLRSPSAGGLARQGLDRDAQIAAYCEGGAAAISVLTEPEEFGGSLDHLRDAAALAATHGRPVMRKDFLTDPYQVIEARAAGAGGVLIIVTMLSDADVEALLEAAR